MKRVQPLAWLIAALALIAATVAQGATPTVPSPEVSVYLNPD
jgi:hypothetical protein